MFAPKKTAYVVASKYDSVALNAAVRDTVMLGLNCDVNVQAWTSTKQLVLSVMLIQVRGMDKDSKSLRCQMPTHREQKPNFDEVCIIPLIVRTNLDAGGLLLQVPVSRNNRPVSSGACATFYRRPYWRTSIALCVNRYTSSCGRCYEMKCRNGDFTVRPFQPASILPHYIDVFAI